MAHIYNYTSDTIITGTDSADYISNSGHNYYVGRNVTINSGSGNDTILNWDDGGSSSINAGAGNDYISNEASIVTILGGNGNDDISNFGQSTKISCGSGNDSIYNSRYSPNSKISGESGNDYIENGGSYCTIYGGKGDDSIYIGEKANYVLINYAAGDGNDLIQGFNSTSTLSIGGGTYSTKKSGDDVVVTVGDGKITLWGAASLNMININGTKATSTTLTVTNSTKSPVTVDSAVKVIDASKRTTAVKITGNALANKISGGSKNDSLYGAAGNDSINGGAGNDKLFGGTGNDSFSGGDGNDIFIYKPGEGTDTITDYASGDILKILKADGSKGGYTKAAFASNKLTLTINGGGSVIFKNVSAGDKININGAIRTISGNTLK